MDSLSFLFRCDKCKEHSTFQTLLAFLSIHNRNVKCINFVFSCFISGLKYDSCTLLSLVFNMCAGIFPFTGFAINPAKNKPLHNCFCNTKLSHTILHKISIRTFLVKSNNCSCYFYLRVMVESN